MTTANSNKRASLLDGLRTGGVRSSSLNVPHTAAPTGTFNVPRFPPINSQSGFAEEEEDQFVDIPHHNNNNNGYTRNIPMTAAVDGPNNRFSQQQAMRGMNPNSIPFSPGFAPNNQQVQLQMLQLEMMRMQVSIIIDSLLFIFLSFRVFSTLYPIITGSSGPAISDGTRCSGSHAATASTTATTPSCSSSSSSPRKANQQQLRSTSYCRPHSQYLRFEGSHSQRSNASCKPG